MTTIPPTDSAMQKTTWPSWYTDQQASASCELADCPDPKRTDEQWRFSDLKAIDTSLFLEAPGVANPTGLIARSTINGESAGHLIFGNNECLASDSSGLPEGALLTTLDDAAIKHADLLQEFFMAQPVELGSHKFALLHRANLQTGAFIYVPSGVEVQAPVHVFHWVEGQNSTVYPHTLIICGENSRLTVVDHFLSSDGLPAFSCGVNDLHLARGARLHYAAIQRWAPESLAVHLNSTVVDRDASATSVSANFGSRFMRGESLSRLAGEGSRSEMFTLNPLTGSRQVDLRTLQDHAAPGATSDLLYLNTLDDVSRSVFSWLIKVEEGAHRTDAYQKVRNLMLSDAAEANSMPGLEILADDVRCSHGATSGEINEEELYYLQARGIPKNTARRLITRGFFQTLLNRVEDKNVREVMEKEISADLAG